MPSGEKMVIARSYFDPMVPASSFFFGGAYKALRGNATAQATALVSLSRAVAKTVNPLA